MSSGRAIVFANGECNARTCSLANIRTDDFLLCIDGGVRHCLQAQLSPDIVVGDLDSLDTASKDAIQAQQIECVRYPKDKDASDLQLGLELLIERSCEQVVLLGVSGGRSDHSLFNWQLAGSRAWPFQLRLLDDSVCAHVVDVAHPLSLSIPAGQTFSVIPVAHDAQGVCVSGARYPLQKASLSVGSTLGLSNEVTESRLQVSVDAGIVLVMLVHLKT